MLFKFTMESTIYIDDVLEPFTEEIQRYVSACAKLGILSALELMDERFGGVIQMVDEAFDDVEF